MNPTFKTILQLVQERIAEQAAMANHSSLKTIAHEALMRMLRRYEQDPAVVLLTDHCAKALLTVLPILPGAMKVSTAQSVMAQVIQDWRTST